MLRFLCLLAFISVNTFSANAQRTPGFISLSGNRGYPSVTNPVPYEKPQTRFEYIDSSSVFLQQKKTGWTYTAYFEISDSLQEFGIRILSPLPDLLSPGKGDLITTAFEGKPVSDHSGFKPEIYLLKAVAKSDDMNFLEQEDMTPVKQKDWSNPTIRLVSKDEKNLLSPGIYKLMIFTKDRSKPSGSFALQFGSIPRRLMPDMHPTPDPLIK